MAVVNWVEADSHWAHLLDSIEHGTTQEVVIARDGQAVAKLVSVKQPPIERRIGIAKGCFEVPETIDVHNEAVAQLF